MSVPVRVSARIDAVEPLGAGVRSIRLFAEDAPPFLPGQYLQVVHGRDSAIPFSIASPPAELPWITLHYLAQPGAEEAARMDAILAGQGNVELLLPCGECGFVAPLSRPLLALAGGSGIAQVRSILHALLPAAVPLRLYWGTATTTDLYLRAELDALASRHAHFSWVAATEASGDGERQGRVADVVAADIAAGELRLEDWEVLIAGGPPMVWGTVAALRQQGLTEASTRSDVFSYAPRADLWQD